LNATDFPDIFGSSFRLPSKVCIVAPGPNGKGHYGEIPGDFFQIAVSKAVLIPGLNPAVWVMNHSQQDWFANADQVFNGVRIFGDGAVISDVVLASNASECYGFTPPAEHLSADHLPPVDGCIRIGGTVSGCALQIAYNFGAHEILLCGVDMSGDEYWDGTSNVQATHGPVWNASRSLNLLLHWMTQEKGLKIWTLSPTRLDVRFFPSSARSG
jgi:hypothetical protein